MAAGSFGRDASADAAVTDPERAPATPAGPSPLRSPGSIRRTASIDVSWPDGLGKPVAFGGRARDIVTPIDGGDPAILSEDWVRITGSPGREIKAIETSRDNDAAQVLIGLRAGGRLRAALGRVLPDELSESTPLHLLIDDFSGASLVATWAWSRWDPHWMTTRRREGVPMTAGNAGNPGNMVDVCSGFRAGSSALRPDGTSDSYLQSSAVVPPLAHPDDPAGWHALPVQIGVGHRRARRIDVTEDTVIHIDAGFQDSGATPQVGQRAAVHEYRVLATASAYDFTLLSIDAIAHVLPYRECPAATANVARMVGRPLADFRTLVTDQLKGAIGCTHLNDVLRGLADVPMLVAALRAHKARENGTAG